MVDSYYISSKYASLINLNEFIALKFCVSFCWTIKWISFLCLYIYIHIYRLYIYIHTHIGEGNGTPLQYSCLENPVDGGACWAAVHGVEGSQTWLSDFTFTFHFHALEKEMATHSSVLAWRIPETGEPGGLRPWGLTESDMTKVT